MAEFISTITGKLHLMAQSPLNYDDGVFQGDNFSDNVSVKRAPLAFVRFKKGSNNKLTANAIRNATLSVEMRLNSNGGKFINGKEEITINMAKQNNMWKTQVLNSAYVGPESDQGFPIYRIHSSLDKLSSSPFDPPLDVHVMSYLYNKNSKNFTMIWINSKYIDAVVGGNTSSHSVAYNGTVYYGEPKKIPSNPDNYENAEKGIDPNKNYDTLDGTVDTENMEVPPGPPPGTTNTGQPPKGEEGELYRWIYENMNSTRSFVEDQLYWDQLYNEVSQFKIRSLRSVIGMPFHFMGNVDPSVGDNEFGKQFTEDILFDMPIAMLRPGGPTMNTGILADQKHMGLVTFCKNAANFYSRYMDGNTWKEVLFGDDQEFSWGSDLGEGDIGILEQVFLNLFIGKYARFYTFSQDFTKYVEYVNTLCHLFIHFLGIGDKKYLRNDGECIKYTYYNDTWEMLENDKGETVRGMFGPNRSIYVYYQPESQLNQTYTNTTKPSMLQDTLTEASNVAKEFGFFAGVAGIDSIYDTNKGLLDFSKVFDWLAQNNGSSFISRFLGNATEGISTVIAGNEMDLPEIWDNSTATTSHTLLIKLVSPYGDPESIFLYVLRPLARLLAMSLPRQFGPNSYTSPFLIQAFSKGQFNCQCGIVSSISVQRCGNGGESHSMAIIPTELEVTMEIQDLYELVTLSNEYLGSGSEWNTVFDPAKSLFHALIPSGSFRAARLLFNNIGLIDFCAAYCGFNINSPEQDTMIALIHDMWINRISDTLEVPQIMGVQKWRIGARLDREMADSFYSSIFKKESFISG